MDFKFALLENIVAQSTNHPQGVKKVFENWAESNSALTQFAFGLMPPGQQSGFHTHATMHEYFYFIKGTGTYYINDDSIGILPSTFIKIPAGARHNLSNSGSEDLAFVYFGIAI